MRKLLIISADFTGHGHKSIAEALTERLRKYEDLQIRIVDGFDMMTDLQKLFAEKTYGPVTRLPGDTWKISYAAGMRLRRPIQHVFAMAIKGKFESLLYEFKPDCILTVHPMFVGCILDLLEELELDIPFISHEADLIDFALQWIDSRISMTYAPSREAYEFTLEHGIPPEKVKQVGFPVRSRFMGLAREYVYEKDKQLTITVMSGSEGAGILQDVTRQLLKNTNAKVNVICGRNKAMKVRLRKKYGYEYRERLSVMGFVDRIQDVMCESDILIMRASPNAVMEAVVLNKPVILFGQLAGQELRNPEMLEKHGLAVYCPDPQRLPEIIEKLIADEGAGIRQMIECQKKYAYEDAAERTAKLINEFIQPSR
ncbi:MAG: glycosyltransferase [Christensenellales bacterium]|nr:glycosyltransferase [Christensenellales bacterium]